MLNPSKLPGASSRLVALLRAKVDADTVDVRDGPARGQPRSTVITVGWSTAERAAYETTHQAPEGFTPNDVESWVLRGFIAAVSGGLSEEAVAEARDSAAAALAVLHGILGDNPKLDGTCSKAVMGDVRWFIYVIPEKGVEFQLEWEIHGWGLL